MALLALSYPSISDSHLRWIQTIRAQHDAIYYDIVAPHFTLVFPTFDRDQQAFSEHIHSCVQKQPAIAITLSCALVVKDQLSDYTHTFLVPDRGFGDMVKLHDKLYTGFLADQLRLDIPYIPHMGVATSLDPLVCKRVADEINRQNPSIPGYIRTIDIVSLANRTITTLDQIALAD